MVACFTLLSTLLPAQSRVDSLVQEIEALKSAYVQELDSLWDELHALAKLPERAKINENEQKENPLIALRMQEYVDSICYWTIRPDFAGFTAEDEFVYHRYIYTLIWQSDLGVWYSVPFMLEYFDKENDCGDVDYYIFKVVMLSYMGLPSTKDLKPIIEQLGAVSEGARRQSLRRFSRHLDFH